MGCYKSKPVIKYQLETSKSIDPGSSGIISSIVRHSSAKNSQNLVINDRKSSKHKEQVGDSRIEVVNNTRIEASMAIKINRPKTLKEIQEISKALSRHFLFNSLTNENIQSFIEDIELYTLGPQQILFEQNSPGQNFYIICSGRIEVIVNQQKKRIMGKGEQFGELALLHDSLRTATIKTIDNTSLWVLSRQSFQKAVKDISNKNYEENKVFISSVQIFQALTPTQKENLLSVVVTQTFVEGQKIVIQGDPGNILYIIKKGSVVCICDGKQTRKMWPGESFGEQALLYNTERTATVIAACPTVLLSLGRDDLVSVLGDQLQQIIYRNTQRIAIEKNQILKSLKKFQKENIIDKMTIKKYEAGQIVIPVSSSIEEKLYIVLKGSLKTNSKVFELYDCIGIQEIYSNTKKTSKEDFISSEETYLSEISKTELESVLGGCLEKIVTSNEILFVLKKVQLFKTLPLSKLESLITTLKLCQYSDQERIFKQGDQGDAFYVVKEGEVEILKDNYSIRTIHRLDYFGERSIILNENRTATVISKGFSICWKLDKKDFLSLMDESVRNLLYIRMQLQNDQIKLDDLLLVKQLGKGMFGQVFLAYSPQNNFLYALKTVSRQKINSFKIHENLAMSAK
jgi:cGMP-dependent protein kinase 1